MATPFAVTEADFEEKVLKNPLPVLVDFWATWCGPCRMIAPIVEELAKDLDGKLAVGKVDVDSSPSIAEKYGVQSIPTLLIFKGGTLAKTVVGYIPKPAIVKALNEAGIS